MLPLLVMLVFGIIDYGLLYNNSLSLRQGIRESARQGVVRNFTTTGCTTGTDLVNLVCKTDKTVAGVGGTAYSKVVVPQGWTKGKPLKVCSMVKTHGATGLVPYPSGGWLKQQVQMSIEADTAPLPTGLTTASDPLPAGSGVNWAWCT